MANSLTDELITLIKNTSTNNPPPERCTITKVYPDGTHCDVETERGELKYVDAIGSNIQLGNNAVILFFDENFTDYTVIADTGTISPCSFDVDEENEELVFRFCGESIPERDNEKSTTLIIEETALSNLEIEPNTNQSIINQKIDTLFGQERNVDTELSTTSTNPVENRVITNNLNNKQPLLISGTNIKTINSQSLLGEGNINIQGGGGSGGSYINDYYWDIETLDIILDYDNSVDVSNIVNSWSSPLNDDKVPSEKLAKNTLDTKQTLLVSGVNIKTINNESLLGGGNINIQGGGSSVDIVTEWEQILSDEKVASEKLVKNSIDNLNIPSKLSDLTNDTGFITSSSLPTKLSDLTNDSDFIETSSTSGLIRNDGTVDTTNYSTFDGNYNNLTNKPTIPTVPTNVSAFTNDAGYLTQHQSLSNYIQKSSTNGLLRNNGTVDTTSYVTTSAISGMLTNSDIVDNLTTSDSTKVLSAKQGKELKDLIGNAINYINQ